MFFLYQTDQYLLLIAAHSEWSLKYILLSESFNAELLSETSKTQSSYIYLHR